MGDEVKRRERGGERKQFSTGKKGEGTGLTAAREDMDQKETLYWPSILL